MQLVTLLQPLLVIAIGMSLLDLPAGAPHLLAGALLVVAVAVGLWGTRDAPVAPT
nr:MAG: xapx domain-containing protein [Pseudomonadota bacterium]